MIDGRPLYHRTEQQKQIQKLENDIRKLTEKRAGGYDSEEDRKKKPKRSHLEEELAKYENSRGIKKKDVKGKKARDEDDILARMNAFKTKLKQTSIESDEEGESGRAQESDRGREGDQESKTAEAGDVPAEEPAMEVDTDTGFLSHKLYFPKDNTEEVMKAERDYEVIDPRQRSARAREEERARKSKARPRDGGRGYRR